GVEHGDAAWQALALLRLASVLSWDDPGASRTASRACVALVPHVEDQELRLHLAVDAAFWRLQGRGWNAEDAELVLEVVGVVGERVAAQRVRPRPEGRRSLALDAAAPEDDRLVGVASEIASRSRRETLRLDASQRLAHERRLADAGLAGDQHEPTGAGARGVHGVGEHAALGVASDERRRRLADWDGCAARELHPHELAAGRDANESPEGACALRARGLRSMRRVRSSSPSLLDSVDEGRTRQGERDQAARVAAADLVAR